MSKHTSRGYTYTGLWTVIQRWLDRLAAVDRRRDRQAAREREETAARERIRRENNAAAFDEKIAKRRAR